MDDRKMETAAPSNSAETSTVLPESFDGVGDAWQHWIAARDKAAESSAETDNPQDLSAEDADPALDPEPATAEHESSGEDDAALDENQDPGEDQDADPEAKLPPIARPKSWAKDDQAEWDSLTRSQQEKIAARDETREKAIRKAQNEAAEKSKAFTAKEQAAEQARTHYEAQAKAALNVLLREQQRDFPDVQSMDDVRTMAASDPLRYLQWQAHQQELQVQATQVQQAQAREAQAAQGRRASYEAEQSKRLAELVPELADAKKLGEARERAVTLLTGDDIGLTMDQLQKWMASEVGHEILSHAGIQKLIYSNLKLADVRAAAQKATAKPVPQVQRPGVKPASGRNSERVSALTQRFQSSGSLDDAAALHAARRSSRRSA